MWMLTLEGRAARCVPVVPADSEPATVRFNRPRRLHRRHLPHRRLRLIRGRGRSRRTPSGRGTCRWNCSTQPRRPSPNCWRRLAWHWSRMVLRCCSPRGLWRPGSRLQRARWPTLWPPATNRGMRREGSLPGRQARRRVGRRARHRWGKWHRTEVLRHGSISQALAPAGSATEGRGKRFSLAAERPRTRMAAVDLRPWPTTIQPSSTHRRCGRPSCRRPRRRWLPSRAAAFISRARKCACGCTPGGSPSTRRCPRRTHSLTARCLPGFRCRVPVARQRPSTNRCTGRPACPSPRWLGPRERSRAPWRRLRHA